MLAASQHAPTAGAEPPAPRWSWRQRLVAAIVIAVFAGVGITTTVASVARYCLTTDGANTRALTGAPGAAPAPGPVPSRR